jgi:hypothetical protein
MGETNTDITQRHGDKWASIVKAQSPLHTSFMEKGVLRDELYLGRQASLP